MLDAFTTANPAPGLGQGALDAVAMRTPGRTRCINAENPDGGLSPCLQRSTESLLTSPTCRVAGTVTGD